MCCAKFFLWSIAGILLTSSCNFKSADVHPIIKKDTIVYTPPVPGAITREESERLSAEVQSFYDSALVRHGFNGGILVAKKGNIVFEQYHGFVHMDKKDSINAHSPFHLASVSKNFTAMATLLLAQQHKLSIDDSLGKFFPGFPYPGVTVKLLLSHRSGLPNYVYFMQELGWDVKKPVANQDILDYLYKFRPNPIHPPNTHFHYCNTNFALLALIIEKVSGKTYPEFMKQNIFVPLHMNDSYVFTMANLATAMPSYNYRGKMEAFTFLDQVYGDKNIYSTPGDIFKWDQALYSGKMFTPQTLEAAFTPYSNEKKGIRNYGYGWRMDVFPDGKKIIYHNGWWHGNNTVFIRLIQDSATIIVLGNKYNRSIYDSKKMANFFRPYFVKDEGDESENILGPGALKDSTSMATAPFWQKPKTQTTVRHKIVKTQRRKR